MTIWFSFFFTLIVYDGYYRNESCELIIYLHLFLQVEDIESKVDLLIDMYKEDRKILLQCAQQTPPTQTEITSCLKNSLTAPRSILQDRTSSEPSTPTMRNSEKGIQRNLSDLSQRIKKRVTYRLLSLNEADNTSNVSRYTIPQHRTRNLSSDSEDDTDNSSSAFESKDQDPLSDPVITFTVEKEVKSSNSNSSIPRDQNKHSIKGKRKLSSSRKTENSSDSVCNNNHNLKEYSC